MYVHVGWSICFQKGIPPSSPFKCNPGLYASWHPLCLCLIINPFCYLLYIITSYQELIESGAHHIRSSSYQELIVGLDELLIIQTHNHYIIIVIYVVKGMQYTYGHVLQGSVNYSSNPSCVERMYSVQALYVASVNYSEY